MDFDGLAVEANLALVGLIQAVEDFHQRGLARAVLAQQRVDFPGAQVEVHVVVGDQRPEALGDPAQFDGLEVHWNLQGRPGGPPLQLIYWPEGGAASLMSTRNWPLTI